MQRKLEDITSSRAALVEKIATAQTQAEGAGLTDLAGKLGVPLSSASNNAGLMRALRGEVDKARDRARQAPPRAGT